MRDGQSVAFLGATLSAREDAGCEGKITARVPAEISQKPPTNGAARIRTKGAAISAEARTAAQSIMKVVAFRQNMFRLLMGWGHAPSS